MGVGNLTEQDRDKGAVYELGTIRGADNECIECENNCSFLQ
jgi:hypothetical protein